LKALNGNEHVFRLVVVAGGLLTLTVVLLMPLVKWKVAETLRPVFAICVLDAVDPAEVAAASFGGGARCRGVSRPLHCSLCVVPARHLGAEAGEADDGEQGKCQYNRNRAATVARQAR
jgi:hypothetical protein